MSCSGRPARSTMALPSPVQVWAEVAGEIGAAIAAGRQNGLLGAEAVQRAVIQFPGGDAAAGAVIIHDQVEAKYSMKNSVAWRRHWPYSVCRMA
jgi:hypothetical protein